MATSEDAATVLENFVHDVANMPAEIAHLLEEVQAKDKQMEEHRNHISQRDRAIQNLVKRDGGHAPQPKEATYVKGVKEHFDHAERIQKEKCLLADKVAILLDRHVKRLDQSIERLVQEGQIPLDSQLPSLLNPHSGGNLAPPAAASSGTNTGVTTPLAAALSHSAGSSTLIADAAAIRLRQSGALTRPGGATTPAIPGVQGQNGSAVSNGGTPGPSGALTAPNAAMAARQRELSAGADPKRRRAGAPGTLQLPPSGLRQSSAGPPGAGTPKVGTPGGSRAGSAGPRTKKGVVANKKLPGKGGSLLKKAGTKGLSKKQARRLAAKRNGASPSTTGDDDGDDASGSGSDAGSDVAANAGASVRGQMMGKDGAADEDMEDAGYDEDGDDAAYCICQKPSFGNMVACDNEKCELEWFHWDCVHLTAEPKGKWLCPNCRILPPSKIKYAR
ncbi:hypothetical protein FH972_022680 [Carpinus fangiana]|uniref:PHD finger protein ING n=1 Tax=Carpinus fangiana TaxID=176857 RepID=A0A5N6KTL4_9ROSI|nr:hypothetical protein FH972_022680 [Carpinus fangiana]